MFYLKIIILILVVVEEKLCQSQKWVPIDPSYIVQSHKVGKNYKIQNNNQFFALPPKSNLYGTNLQYLQHSNAPRPQIIIIPQVIPQQKEIIDFQKPKTQTFYKAALSETEAPVYEFRYKVHDPKENNFQEKFETRIGDTVKGYYSVREPNGYLRLVKYVSDKSGFRTQVSHHHMDQDGGNSFTYASTQHPT